MDSRAESEFREFVESRSLALRRTAYALTGDLHVAEDLVQGALVKLVRRWHKVDNPEAYVRRTIYHDHASRWRRRKIVREDTVADLPDRSVGDGAGQVDDRLDLRQALLRLTARQRAVLVLRFYEDLPEREVAEIMGCSVGTVRSQTARALARVRVLAPELAADAALPTPEEASA
ncbi:SigE family RNA polymerase sigma factor [Jiangella alkaliphila]|uniref:RNA polymerase sigma-70 factor, sigma-E family n=1 Tax=Jiangella alkaliphila TaxID=419479 RepID=A0A1H2LMH4_9ACTN|nr:SigE family RNA polymerase sigma factor [Jiangella alkaliphila]SDU82024.1 RNA polymerase sigma-70 factor, sigma-E family [Jiangella alkaliphila]